MAWRERLRDASYKGVPFLYESVESTGGRRNQITELPGRDVPHTKDLGRATSRFSIDAYILGDDYDVRRDLFLRAIDDARPGKLVHPYWGNRTVVTDGPYRITETTKEGGMCRISVTFADVSAQDRPVRQRDWRSTVAMHTVRVQTQAKASLEAVFTVADTAAEVREAAAKAVATVMRAISRVKSEVNQALELVDTVQQSITEIIDTATTLVKLPGELATKIGQAVAAVVASVADAVNFVETLPDTIISSFNKALVADTLMRAWRDLFNIGDTLEKVEAGAGRQTARKTNQEALIQLIQVAATSETCRVLTQLPLDSSNQAVAIRDELAAAIDELADVVDDETYDRLLELRLAIHKYLTTAAGDLPQVITLTLEEAIPALTLAHNLYGDPERDLEILDRNPHVSNPTSLPVGTVLQVLNK